MIGESIQESSFRENSDIGESDENTYSDDEIDLVVNSDELLKNVRPKRAQK